MNSHGPEQHNSLPSSLEDLQAGREYLARQHTEAELQEAFDPRIVLSPNTALHAARANGFRSDEGRLSAPTLMALEAVGIDPDQLLQSTNNADNSSDERIASAQFSGTALDVYPYRQGISFQISPTTHESSDKARSLDQLIADRWMQSPAHKALLQAGQKLEGSDTIPESVTTEPFSIREDPLGSLVFMSKIGLTSSIIPVDTERSVAIKDLPARALQAVPSTRAAVIATKDGKTSYTWGEDIRKQLIIDAEGNATYSVSQRPVMTYLEQANANNARSLPFIETDCAKALTGFLDDHDLMFHPSIQAEMMQVGAADRFGVVFTQMSREVAKWIDSPDRAIISKLFVPRDPAYAGLQLAQTQPVGQPWFWGVYNYESFADENASVIEDAVREKLMTADLKSDGSTAADTLLGMVAGVLHRTFPATSDLSVTSEIIEISDGACFDVLEYYMTAGIDGAPSLHKVTNGEVPLLQQLRGKNTFLSTEPLMFNGVQLPKGSLFNKADDGKWAFMRLTPFSFDNPADQMAFGSEISKTFNRQLSDVMKLGEVSISTLTKRAR